MKNLLLILSFGLLTTSLLAQRSGDPVRQRGADSYVEISRGLAASPQAASISELGAPAERAPLRALILVEVIGPQGLIQSFLIPPSQLNSLKKQLARKPPVATYAVRVRNPSPNLVDRL